jgi:hypothetical protein
MKPGAQVSVSVWGLSYSGMSLRYVQVGGDGGVSGRKLLLGRVGSSHSSLQLIMLLEKVTDEAATSPPATGVEPTFQVPLEQRTKKRSSQLVTPATVLRRWRLLVDREHWAAASLLFPQFVVLHPSS